MCGIAGIVERASSRDDVLDAMLATIAHRGPDGRGAWRASAGEWRIALGHRRLSIIDLATGAQPMTLAGRNITITYNGEIYNYRELRDELEGQSGAFATRSDTEVILRMYAAEGIAGLRRLAGMFAFALWDDTSKTLVLARDRVGIKPLYYAPLHGGGLAFASELTSLLEHPSVRRVLSTDGLVSYFFSDYAHAPSTLIDDVKKLEPGHVLAWQPGRPMLSPVPFVRLPEPEPETRAIGPLAREVWERLEAAVERQLVADVPVGVFLSGGLDSSIVATLAARRASTPRKAFSIGFRDQSFDETGYARTVADLIGAEHIVRVLDEGSLLDVVKPALDALDEPLADPSYLPTYLLSQLASEHVKVVVSGDGADELWGGYPSYLAHQLAPAYARLPDAARRLAADCVARLPVGEGYQGLQWKLSHFTGRWDADPFVRHLRWLSSTDLEDVRRAVRGAEGLVPATLRAAPPRGDDVLASILALDLGTYLPGSVLTKVDRASMAHGLEVRPALLDDALVDFALRLPSHLKVRRLTRKLLLKKAATGHVPRAVIARPKKGFAIPLARWINGPLAPLVAGVLADSPVWEVLHREAFRAWQREHAARRVDRSKPLWALLVLNRWMRRTSAR